MESWKLVWRDGIQVQFSGEQLRKLLHLLKTDSRHLTQGSTTTPPPLMCVADWPMEAGDLIALAGADVNDSTVGEAEEFFARTCFECDQRLGEPAACRWWLNWFDDTPRNEMRTEVIKEIELELVARGYAPTQLDPLLEAAWKTEPSPALSCAISDWYRDQGDETAATLWDEGKLK